MRFSFFVLFSLLLLQSPAQPIREKLSSAFRLLENDSQLKSGIASIYVADGVTGNLLFEKNGYIGLAPASTQKIITAATAYELLGKDFRYHTRFGYSGQLRNGNLDGALYLKPSGDPTFGSWRWPATAETTTVRRVATAIQKAGIRSFRESVYDESGWESETIPGGWIWDDIGNYYGAGAGALNWRENQYDLFLKSGTAVGDPVTVVGTKPKLYGFDLLSRVTSAAKGTGDNSYIYFPLTGNTGIVRGTIPVNEERFIISGAMPSAPLQFLSTLHDTLTKIGYPKELNNAGIKSFPVNSSLSKITFFHTETSPPLDSICYWFLKRSINLYGEALAKTMALQGGKTASASQGALLIRNHWKEKGIGIDATELNIHDGSGLSPQNRVTTHAQVAILFYAQKQAWFAGYVNGFPEFNGMKLKSGTIGGAKGFCGYHTAKDGKRYIVSFLVNNYNGSSAALVQKMYKVLDVLK
ncbi:MAG TPA: D-alanyl-D-alanine carboxypeptidase/D-alanyl-D-alanine-endopeptidase [Flavisolibacter sp.]|nr:D-alanyl-D-alanine carboxypeptidase/D-alanyl-D-alanine-endopeptidase [Flavisolibacter sp.]